MSEVNGSARPQTSDDPPFPTPDAAPGELPVAAVVFVIIFAASGISACWQTGDHIFVAVGVLQTIYALIVIMGTLAASRKATALLRSHDRSAA